MGLITIDNRGQALRLSELYRNEICLRKIILNIPPDMSKWCHFKTFQRVARICIEHKFHLGTFIKAGFKYLYPSAGRSYPLPPAYYSNKMPKYYSMYQKDMEASYGRNWGDNLDDLKPYLDLLYDGMYWYKLLQQTEPIFEELNNCESTQVSLVKKMLEMKKATWPWLHCQNRLTIPLHILPQLETWVKSVPYGVLHKIANAYRVKLQSG